MTVELDYLNDPEYLQYVAVEQALYAEYRKVADVHRAAFDDKRAFVDLWWEENINRFDLLDVDDFLIFAKASWANGRGSRLHSDYVSEHLKAHGVNKNLYSYGWIPVKDDATLVSDNSCFTYSLNFNDHTVDEQVVQNLADYLTKFFVVGNAAAETFWVNVSTNRSHENYVLTVEDDVVNLNLQRSYSRELEMVFAGTMVEVLTEINSQYNSCSCRLHTQEDDYDYYGSYS